MKDGGVKSNGERCSIHNFGSRKRYTPSTEKEIQRIINLPLTDIKDIPDADDGEKHEWVMVGCWTHNSPNCESSSRTKSCDEDHYGFPKYGRHMFCLKTGLKRMTTFGEFYEDSIVD